MNPDNPNSMALTRRGDQALTNGLRHHRPYPPAEPAESGSGPSMAQIYAKVRKSKLKIALGAFLGVLVGMATFVAQPIVYPARTTVEVLGINENFMNFNQVDPTAGSGLYSVTNSNLQTQIRILESTDLRKRVLDRLRLTNIPTQPANGGFAQRMRVKLGIVEAEPVAAMRQALNMAIQSTRAGVIRETRIIEIRCQSTNPDVAASYLNTLVSEYADYSLEVRSNSARKTMEWLSNQLRDARERVDQSAAKLRDFERSSGYTATTPGDTLAGSRLRQLRAELAILQADRIAKQTRYEKVRSAPPENLIDVAEDATLRSKEAQILEIRRQLADLRTVLTPNHYRIQRLMAQLAEVEADAKRDRQSIVERAKNEYESASTKERALLAAHNTQSAISVSENTQAGERQAIQREMDMAQTTYNGLLQQATQAGMVAAVPSAQVRTVDSADPSFPPIGLGGIPRVMFGFIAGGILASVFVVAREMMNRTVRSSSSAVGLLHLPDLGVIPTGVTPVQVLNDTSTELIVPKRDRDSAVKQTAFAESFRATLASLMLNAARRAKGGGGAPIYVISSPGPVEGKTFVTTNLGMAIAETGRKVVVVDFDLRRPGLSMFFNQTHQFGVGDLVLSQEDLIAERGISGFVQPTFVPNLSLLSAGTVGSDKMSLILYHMRLQRLIEKLGQEFDFVLIDTAPVGLVADARVIGHLSDGVILVLRADQTTRDSALEARRRLEEDGTPLAGVILNDSKMTEKASHYHYYAASESPRYPGKA